MSLILLIGIVMFGVPFALIVGFAGYIFVSFMNDDKDAKMLFHVALLVMLLGVVLIGTYYVGSWVALE